MSFIIKLFSSARKKIDNIADIIPSKLTTRFDQYNVYNTNYYKNSNLFLYLF